MRNGLSPVFVATLSLLDGQELPPRTGAIVVDHTCADITRIPQGAILDAKAKLHIAYGHTSHGSQIISGMNGLVGFANGGGKGLTLPKGIFTCTHGGANGALDLYDSAMAGDVGYYPDWVNNTRTYLNNPQNADVNVVMWSWCGQVSGKYSGNKLLTEYLEPMSQLERDYPHVTFVYMTGHVDHSDDANNKAANQVIRAYCKANGKVLYDFADIESFDPDGVYCPFPNDSCGELAEGSVEAQRCGSRIPMATVGRGRYDSP
jgi:hypothetical protein